jgi:hypothetical protein
MGDVTGESWRAEGAIVDDRCRPDIRNLGAFASGSRRDAAMRRRPRLREVNARDSQWYARCCRYGEASSRVLPRVSGVTLDVDALAFTTLPPVGTLTICSQRSDIIRRTGRHGSLIVQALPFHSTLRRDTSGLAPSSSPNPETMRAIDPAIPSHLHRSLEPSSCSHTAPHQIQIPHSTDSRHQFTTAQNTAPHPVHLPFTVFEASMWYLGPCPLYVQTSTCHTVPFRTVPFEGRSASSHLPLAGSHHDRRQGNAYHPGPQRFSLVPPVPACPYNTAAQSHMYFSQSQAHLHISPHLNGRLTCISSDFPTSIGMSTKVMSTTPHPSAANRGPQAGPGPALSTIDTTRHTQAGSGAGILCRAPPPWVPVGEMHLQQQWPTNRMCTRSEHTTLSYKLFIQIYTSQLPPLFIPDELSRPVHTIHDASYSTTL